MPLAGESAEECRKRVWSDCKSIWQDNSNADLRSSWTTQAGLANSNIRSQTRSIVPAVRTDEDNSLVSILEEKAVTKHQSEGDLDDTMSYFI